MARKKHFVYEKYVEIGRVAYINYGQSKGQIGCIVDVIDQNRVLIDGPNIPRQSLNLKYIQLTKFVLPKLSHSAKRAALMKRWTSFEIDQKWADTQWAKRLVAKAERAAMSDFDRFGQMKEKQSKNRKIASVFRKLQKKAKAQPPKAKRVNKVPHIK